MNLARTIETAERGRLFFFFFFDNCCFLKIPALSPSFSACLGCVPPDGYEERNGKYYRLYGNEKTFDDAIEKCHSERAWLAMFKNQDDIDAIEYYAFCRKRWTFFTFEL